VDLIRRTVREVDAAVPVLTLKTFAQHLDGNLELWIVRAGAALFSIFGGLALALATVGVYGVKAYSVARRTREIGIRMALGARATDVLKLIISNGMTLILIGVVVGLAGAFGLTRLLATLLFGVTPTDTLTFAVVSSVLIFVALLACYLPARRATKVDPLVALRYE